MLAGVELGEEVDEVSHVLLLGAGGLVGVIGRHGVQEPPCAAAQLLAVQRTVRWWLLLLCGRQVLQQERGLGGDVVLGRERAPLRSDGRTSPSHPVGQHGSPLHPPTERNPWPLHGLRRGTQSPITVRGQRPTAQLGRG